MSNTSDAPSAAPRVAALGAGRMGRGIALTFACAGHPILVVDAKPRSEADFQRLHGDAMADLRTQLDAMVALQIVPAHAIDAILERISVCSREAAGALLRDVDLLFEGVPEVMEAKAEAFAYACERMRPDAIIASTSSTFLSTSLAEMVSHAERFLNAHWLNPAQLIPLVEISPHPGTAPATVATLREKLEAVGKMPVLCGATPGYIVPRMQVLIMNEAARMIEQGVATAEDIDQAIRFGFGIRYAAMGVVEFIDFGGNDILYYASRYLSSALDDTRYASPPIIARHMEEGRNGLRDGKGFYDWSQRDIDAYRRESTARLVDLLRMAGKLPRVADDVDHFQGQSPSKSLENK